MAERVLDSTAGNHDDYSAYYVSKSGSHQYLPFTDSRLSDGWRESSDSRLGGVRGPALSPQTHCLAIAQGSKRAAQQRVSVTCSVYRGLRVTPDQDCGFRSLEFQLQFQFPSFKGAWPKSGNRGVLCNAWRRAVGACRVIRPTCARQLIGNGGALCMARRRAVGAYLPRIRQVGAGGMQKKVGCHTCMA